MAIIYNYIFQRFRSQHVLKTCTILQISNGSFDASDDMRVYQENKQEEFSIGNGSRILDCIFENMNLGKKTHIPFITTFSLKYALLKMAVFELYFTFTAGIEIFLRFIHNAFHEVFVEGGFLVVSTDIAVEMSKC